MGQLQETEPRFYGQWISGNSPDDPQLDRWETMEADALGYSRERVAAMSEAIDFRGKSVLDIGCQWGATCIALAEVGATPTGLDVTETLMEGARVRAEEQGVEATFRQGLSERLPFDDESFDVAIGLNILEHVESHTNTLREMLRVLKPGGEFYLDMPNRFAPHDFLRDPHYQLFGVSVLPHRLGEFYVTKVRRFPEYEVGVFPIASVIERTLLRNGAVITSSSRRAADGAVASVWEAIRFNIDGKPFFIGKKAK
jgi:2-polyprenyl-3-methyl-5-hydroxy-6-metoxy-1,4-benzoquinol methylase